jgi:hypothetical protein
MNAKEYDRQGAPSNPQQYLHRSRQWLGRFNLAAHDCSSMPSFNLDLHIPAARFRELELGRVDELVGRRLRCPSGVSSFLGSRQ